jgi:NosR/NirI family nitrous oxide reductase transcriptional regulator
MNAVLLVLLVACAMLVPARGASAGSYEAALPEELHSNADLCAYVPCKEVLPEADSYSKRIGNPPYVEAYKTTAAGKSLVGYVFLSTDVVSIPAYSGKPLVTLVGMDARGRIQGVKVLKHSEPILLVGIPESALVKFVHQYIGKLAWDKMEIGKGRDDEGYQAVDAISGATVTVIAENQTIMRSAYEIAREVGILKVAPRPQARLTPVYQRSDWSALAKRGLIERLTVHPSDIGLPENGEPYIDMYFGLLDAPEVGRNVLGDVGYARLMGDLKPGEHAMFVAANGTGSFKGSAFVRGGIFDRIQVKQDYDTLTFRDTDYLNLYSIEAAGAPRFRESGIFIFRNPAFSAAYPWRLVFLANRVDKATGTKTFVNFDREYWLPAQYLEGGRPHIVAPEAAWVQTWKRNAVLLGVFALVLAVTALTYALRDKLVRRATHKDSRWVTVPRYVIWLTAIGFIGFYLKAQPSITQVLTWFHSVLFHWEWELFLSDPFIFVFWWFIIVAVFIAGRGLFCGWLCPYGALSEIAYKLSRVLGLKRFQFALPQPLHDRLKWVKYAVFATLLGVSFYSMGTAEQLAEIEPFKTTFLVGVWNRSWPYVVFWGTLLVWSMLSERPFCKYLCPLGAGLAIPSTFRNFGLKRKAECGPCRACEKQCGSLAIDKSGRIDQRECLLCLDCQILYYDPHACPPLVQERKARTKAGLPLTRITADGYYASLIDAAVEAHACAHPSHRAQTTSDRPDAADPDRSLLQWLVAEAKFHLLPWRAGYAGKRGMLKAAGIGLAAVVTIAWVLSGTGHIGPAVVAAWWIGWSAYEVMSRALHLPWIKEGAWWGRDFRRATLADVAAYVATKNLLIGTVLFAVLHTTGALHALSALQSLRWLH